MIQIKHYVEFLSPGTLFSESTSREISSWDVKEAIELSKNITKRHGAKPYGFRFSTYKKPDKIIDGDEEFNVEPKLVKESGTYYLTGTVRSKEEVLAGTDEKEDILRLSAQCNHLNAIVQNKNSYLTTMPFYKKDCVVDWDGNIIDEGKNYI